MTNWVVWSRLRGLVAAAGGVLVLVGVAAATGLPPFGTGAGAGWKYSALVLVAALLGAFAASAVRSPAGAEMTLRDVRWPSLAVVGLLCSFSPPEGVATAEAVLIATGSAAVAGWAVFGRVAGERAARGRGGPGSCVTCVALLPAARSVPAGSPQGVRVSGPVGAETVPPQHRQHHDASTGSGS